MQNPIIDNSKKNDSQIRLGFIGGFALLGVLVPSFTDISLTSKGSTRIVFGFLGAMIGYAIYSGIYPDKK